jgi:hypothetical protein
MIDQLFGGLHSLLLNRGRETIMSGRRGPDLQRSLYNSGAGFSDFFLV